MVLLKKQKNDQEGKGRWKRIGWGGDLCLVRRVERYLHEAQLYTHADCKKWKDVAMRTTPCGKCGPLFPMVYGGARFAPSTAPRHARRRKRTRRRDRVAAQGQPREERGRVQAASWYTKAARRSSRIRRRGATPRRTWTRWPRACAISG